MATKTKRTKGKNKSTSGRGTCLFSGKPTASARSRFLPGNDAKLKGVLIRVFRGEEAISAIPKAAVPVLRDTGLVGFKLKGDKLEHTGNFEIGTGRRKRSKVAAAARKGGKRVKSKKRGRKAVALADYGKRSAEIVAE
jgi:hypothetical protein